MSDANVRINSRWELRTVGDGWCWVGHYLLHQPFFTSPCFPKFTSRRRRNYFYYLSLSLSLFSRPSERAIHSIESIQLLESQVFAREMVGPQRPQFVLFGSSIVQLSFSNDGWGAILADVYARKADICLRGYYGWNSRLALEVLDQVFPKDAAAQPSLVIAYFGGNDSMGPHSSGLGPHVPLPEYIENMRKIARHLKSLSDTTRVIFLSCPPVNEAKLQENTSKYFSELVRTNELCRSYSEACIKLCQEMGVKVVDLWTAIQRRDDWLTACFTDGIHLSAEGSQVVAEEILKVLKEAEWEPCLHWKSMPTEFGEDSPYYLVAYDGETTINPSEWTYHREIQWD